MKDTSLTRRCFNMCTAAWIAGLTMPLTAFAATAERPAVKAYRNPGCGCCEKWADLMKQAGFDITMEDDDDLADRKEQLGVPADLAGCHTALIGDYVIEGHVPPQDILKFLAVKPVALGLAVPGMPVGSPGMETDGTKDSYEVVQFSKDGSRHVYAKHA